MALASCSTNVNTAEVSDTGASAEVQSGESTQSAASSSQSTSDNKTTASDSSGSGSIVSNTGADISSSDSEGEIPDAADMFTNRDYEIGYSDSVSVKFESGAAAVTGTGAAEENGTVTITEAGTYLISGTITDGQIIVDADGEKVQIVLDNASVTCSGSAALYIKAADKVFVTTTEGSTNSLISTGEFVQTDDNNVDGAVFAKSDITFNGSGILNISSDTAHGIVCKDDIKITSGTYNITAAKKGIDCNESVRTAGGTINITSGTDAIHAENTDEPEKAFVYIGGGSVTLTSGYDGIDASGDVYISDGTLNITSNGGSEAAPTHSGGEDFGMRWDRDSSTDSGSTSESCKGIKSDSLILIGGSADVNIDANDDAVHSDGSLSITGGIVAVKSGDDGLHAEESVTISDGNVTVSKSYEGIEGEIITISGGVVNVTSSDDGMNAAGGNTTSGWGMMDTDQNAVLTISGGTITVNANGDGLDSNGYMYITGGTAYVSGPTNSGNGALDFGIGGTITGGTVIAAGAAGMAENFGSDSTQGSILYTFDSTLSGGTEVKLTDENGNVLASYIPEKNFQCVVISTPDVASGKTYTLTAGGNSYTIEMTSLIYGSGNGMGGFGGGRGGFGGQDGGIGGFGGRRGQNTDAAQSGNSEQATSDGQTPPQMPNGEIPQMPNGEIPQMPGGGRTSSGTSDNYSGSQIPSSNDTIQT